MLWDSLLRPVLELLEHPIDTIRALGRVLGSGGEGMVDAASALWDGGIPALKHWFLEAVGLPLLRASRMWIQQNMQEARCLNDTGKARLTCNLIAQSALAFVGVTELRAAIRTAGGVAAATRAAVSSVGQSFRSVGAGLASAEGWAGVASDLRASAAAAQRAGQLTRETIQQQGLSGALRTGVSSVATTARDLATRPIGGSAGAPGAALAQSLAVLEERGGELFDIGAACERAATAQPKDRGALPVPAQSLELSIIVSSAPDRVSSGRGRSTQGSARSAREIKRIRKRRGACALYGVE